MKKALPVGVENFADIVSSGYYYVDKTMLIKELLDRKGEANLFTRPRRFGKTLNLSMLRYFFEDTGDAEENERNRELFRGLKIWEAGEEYTGQMGGYPVINLTLKSAKQPTFETACGKLKEEIAEEFQRHRYILTKEGLDEESREQFRQMAAGLLCWRSRSPILWRIWRRTRRKPSGRSPKRDTARNCGRRAIGGVTAMAFRFIGKTARCGGSRVLFSGRPERSVSDRVAQGADPFDGAFHDVAFFQEFRRVEAHPGSGRGSRGDDGAGF